MNQILNKIKSLLGVSRPTVSRYKALVGSLSEKEVNKLQHDVFALVYHHWHDLPCQYKRFFHGLFVHYREAFLRV